VTIVFAAHSVLRQTWRQRAHGTEAGSSLKISGRSPPERKVMVLGRDFHEDLNVRG